MSPLPGDFATVATGGRAAQLIRWATRSDVNHAFLCYDITEQGAVRILEMGPDGLKVNRLHYAQDRTHWSRVNVSSTERTLVVERMRFCAQQPFTYNWIADLYIGLPRVGVRPPRWLWKLHAWLSPREYQCAQLVDYIYLAAHVHLFADGRAPGQVAPSDLRKLSPDT